MPFAPDAPRPRPRLVDRQPVGRPGLDHRDRRTARTSNGLALGPGDRVELEADLAADVGGACSPAARNPPNRPIEHRPSGAGRWPPSSCAGPVAGAGRRSPRAHGRAARCPRSPGCRPATTGSRRAASTGRTAGRAGRSRRRNRWARPGSRSSPRSRRRRRGRRSPVRRAPGATDWTVRPSIDTGNGSRCGREAPTTVRGADEGGDAVGVGRGPRVRARRIEHGGTLVGRRGPAEDGGRRSPRQAGRTGTSSTSRRERATTPGRGLVGTGSTIIACRLYALPASADAATLGRDGRDPRAAERRTSARSGRRRCPTRPTGAAATSPTRSTSWSSAGGSTGLSAARRAAELGASVVLLEAERIGWGASTRNGGFCHPGFKQSLTALRRLHGVDAAEAPLPRDDRRLRARRAPVRRPRSTPSSSAPATSCSPRRPPTRPASTARSTRCAAWAWRRTCVPRSDLRTEIGSDAYFGGLVVEQSAGLNPARLTVGLGGPRRGRGRGAPRGRRARSGSCPRPTAGRSSRRRAARSSRPT